MPEQPRFWGNPTDVRARCKEARVHPLRQSAHQPRVLTRQWLGGEIEAVQAQRLEE